MNLTHSLSEFYQRKSSDRSARSHRQEHRKRSGVPRTPVRQKMKTMPRSLQMLNTARLNVKAQKFQQEGEQPTSETVSQRLFPKRPDDSAGARWKTAKSKLCFKTEEEMFASITAQYQRAVTPGENVLRFAREMVTAVNANNGPVTFVQFLYPQEAAVDTIRSSLLKTSQHLRQQLSCDSDKETKIKECQLQVYLRLEMCLQCPSLQTGPDGTEELVEEVTEMLRILCLTKDPGYLARFLDEVVDTYLESIPKLLGDLYYSLGTQIPPKLASLLPADLFSDDSVSQEGPTPILPASAASVPPSRPASITADTNQLEELRSRSAKKRAQFLKVTKVRRNLFNENMLSPGKRSLAKIPRSQSVSAVEGLKHKHSQSSEGTRGSYRLLTKSVAETPVHKQISRRLLHKQIKGRWSNSQLVAAHSGCCALLLGLQARGLRRSPRIKRLSLGRRPSSSFCNVEESSQKRVQQKYSMHKEAPGDQENGTGMVSPPVKKAIWSPKSLLFGAVREEFNSGEKDSPRRSRKLSSDQPTVYATPRKSPFRSSRRLASPPGVTPRRSPRIHQRAQHVLQKTPTRKCAAAKSLGGLLSPCRPKSKSLPEFVDEKEDRLSREGAASPSRLPAHQPTSGKQGTWEVLDNVFASPASGPDSAALLSVATTPGLRNEGGKVCLGPLSPRRSLRVAQRSASPACAQKQILESERGVISEPRHGQRAPALLELFLQQIILLCCLLLHLGNSP
ncbi:hypothetical protein JRQ81_006687 [Phrynocephalus forsythii]|uniref:Treslin STD domain-containing protein n=1 Tax=Phrynocephalus forsythii TaxID=171643 RepID=A0A9Q1AUD2_9SAUR|nr:hypothetical protein JRQ81_006687 [Phrynocephalus forsythii]